MARLIFVYGTLKEGYRNFHINRGRRIDGVFVTHAPYPLYLIGEFGLPWLLHRPGDGLIVEGQVFEVSDEVLRDMDSLERINEAGYYQRLPLRVQRVDGSGMLSVECYFGSNATFEHGPVLAGPLARYELSHQAVYRYGGASNQ